MQKLQTSQCRKMARNTRILNCPMQYYDLTAESFADLWLTVTSSIAKTVDPLKKQNKKVNSYFKQWIHLKNKTRNYPFSF